MTTRNANATTQNPAAAGLVTSASPDLHAAVDDEVDARDVRALVGGEEQSDVRHLLRLPEPAQQRPAAHLAGPRAVLQLPASGVALDQAGRDRVGTDPVLA